MKIKLLLMSCVLGLVAGCKIAIIVPSGGDVVSSNAAHNCSEGNICEFEINSGQLPFSETLTAIPKAGYVFEKWSDGGEFQCGKSTNPTCTISIADSAVGFAAVSLFDSGYAMPIFKDVGIDTDGDGVRNALDEDDDNDGIFDIDDTCPLDPSPSCSEGVPLTDTVTINGTEWAQVDLFLQLSWNDMNAVCSGGPCSGLLNGYNMAGWTWASRADVIALFDFYICGLEATGCYSGGRYSEVNSTWAPMMFTDGMRPIYDSSTARYVRALVSDVNDADPGFVSDVRMQDGKPLASTDYVNSQYSPRGIDSISSVIAGWFYRNP